MGTRVIRNLDEFAARLEKFSKVAVQGQRAAADKSKVRAKYRFKVAATQLAGGDQTISGVGKSGGRLVVKFNNTVGRGSGGSGSIAGWIAKPGGPWSIRDNSVSGGSTATRIVGPNLRRSPRPIPPASQPKPALLINGQFFSNNRRTAPYKSVNAGQGSRLPAFKNAVQSLQPRIIKIHKDEFDRSGLTVF